MVIDNSVSQLDGFWYVYVCGGGGGGRGRGNACPLHLISF